MILLLSLSLYIIKRKELFMNWRNRFSRFMMGRYGMDSFSRTLIYLMLVIYVINIFIGSSTLYILSIVILVYCYYRMLSKNIYKRALENQTYLEKTARIRMQGNKKIRQWKTLKTHHIYKCSNCKQKIRVPRGKGRISIRCPKCNNEFIKKS